MEDNKDWWGMGDLPEEFTKRLRLFVQENVIHALDSEYSDEMGMHFGVDEDLEITATIVGTEKPDWLKQWSDNPREIISNWEKRFNLSDEVRHCREWPDEDREYLSAALRKLADSIDPSQGGGQ